MIHYLKTHPDPFRDTRSGKKTFEFRYNDRGFEEGDFLILQEFQPYEKRGGVYTGQEVKVMVTHIITEGYGIPEGYCVMSTKVL